MIEFISSRFFLSKFILLLVLGALFATGCAEMENELIELERSEQEISQIKDEEESINKENEILTKANGLEERLLDVEEDKEKKRDMWKQIMKKERLLQINGFKIIKNYSMMQDSFYNILLSLNKLNITTLLKACYISILCFFNIILFGYKKSSSIMVICKKI